MTQPRFSWQIASGKPDLKQTAYQIQVAASPEQLESGDGLLWDSGVVRSDESVLVPYAGKALESGKPYYWRVKLTTNQGDTPWSDAGSWSMALLDDSEWKATWIGEDSLSNPGEEIGVAGGNNKTRLAARYLRKEFTTDRAVERAVLYISGLGSYEAYLNGKKVSEDVFAPMPSLYYKRIYYNVYDVTALMASDKNTLGVILGNGRFFSMRNPGMKTFGLPRLLAQLRIEYADGSQATVVSDTSWKITSKGPIVANNEFDGEEYDARLEMEGWNTNGFDDGAWKTPDVMEAPAGKLTAQQNPNIRVQETLKPVAVFDRPDGKYILDMGQNMVGWLSVNLKGKKGKPVSMKFAELLQKDGSLYLANLRTAQVTDIYTPAEDGDFSWQPRFVYHGFRFVEVSGLDYKPELSAFTGHVIYDEMATTGRFETSNPLVNQIHKNSYWGIRSNYRGMPTDCPQRDERLGWLGDRATGAYGEAFIFNNAQLYNKWLQDIEDSMSPEGSISDVSPNYWTIYADDVTWPSAFFYVADMLYRQFGDDSAIRAHYPAMKRWMAHMEEATMKDYIMTKDQYGDWCMPPESQELIHSKDPARKTDGAILSTTVYYDLLNKMIGFARICGQDADISGYESLAAKIKAAYNAKFFNKETAEYLFCTRQRREHQGRGELPLRELLSGRCRRRTLRNALPGALRRRSECDYRRRVLQQGGSRRDARSAETAAAAPGLTGTACGFPAQPSMEKIEMNLHFPVFTTENICHDCYKCIRHCPCKAIRIVDGRAGVIQELCVACGMCVKVCPAHAKKIRPDLARARYLLGSGKKVYASLAPSFVSFFKQYEPGALVAALKRLGFAGVSETALGAQAVSAETGAFLAQAKPGIYLSSACPAVVDYVKKYAPAYTS